ARHYASAAVREHRVRARELEQRDTVGAERGGERGLERRADPEPPRITDHAADADLVAELERGVVDRFGERLAQRDRAVEFLLVVLRLPDQARVVVGIDLRA